MRRSAKLGSGLLLTAAMLIGMLETTAFPPVHRFLAYYQAVQQTSDSLGFLERVAASLLLVRAEARDAKPPVTSGRMSSL